MHPYGLKLDPDLTLRLNLSPPWAFPLYPAHDDRAGDVGAEEDDDYHGTDGGGDDDDDDLLAPDPRTLRNNRCQGGGGGDPKDNRGNKENAGWRIRARHVYIVRQMKIFCRIFYHFVAK